MRTVAVLAIVALASLAAGDADIPDDYYDVLGVKRDASGPAIRKAYRKLAKTYHPDRNKNDPNAEKMFQAIAEAYEVLSNDDKRQTYDQHGKEGLKEQQQGGGHHPGGFGFFDQFFGGGRRGNQQKKGATLYLDLEVSLRDLYLGTTIEVESSKQVVCPSCRGSGARSPDDVKKCPACKGKGFKVVTHQLGPGFVQQVQQPCNKCKSTGKVVKAKCRTCGGHKVVHGTDDLVIEVEAGMDNGHEIVFPRAGDQSKDIDTTPGDIVYRITTTPHPRFSRRGDDLYMTLPITLSEAIGGFAKKFKHLDGHEVTVKRTKVTQPNFVLKVAEEGMPQHNFPSVKGDLYVEFTVIIPTKLSAEQKKSIKELLAGGKEGSSHGEL
eukprot:m.19896 g.19896  ORF g.19896 m.19896 type:complete len:379 (+) comp3733_c0_seq1:58-1194(+)